MGNLFTDYLKLLEADIQHANTLALGYPRGNDGGCLQFRLAYNPAARFFLFLVHCTGCNLAGALGLLKIHIYLRYSNGNTKSTYERNATIRDFYGVIFPSLLQLQGGITDLEDREQKESCAEKYNRRMDERPEKRKLSEAELELDEECGICMEMNDRVVLPNCGHSSCLECYRDWCNKSKSCPFCRDSLERTNSGDLWIYTDDRDIVNSSDATREYSMRLFWHIDRLPLVVPDSWGRARICMLPI